MEPEHRSHSTDGKSTCIQPNSTSALRRAGILTLVVLVFALVRLPVLLHAPGGQDEEWYGVPGLTIAFEGVPRVPYSRATEPESVFRGAEQMLFAQPPLSFYAQAPFFFLFPDNYGTARLASFAAACVSIVLTFWIAQLLFGDSRVAYFAAVVYSMSRLCFFPAMLARPDMLCGMLGLLAIALMLKWRSQRQSRWLVAVGVTVGLAALTHPFAIVFGVQTTLWTILTPNSLRQRFTSFILLSASVALTFSLWLPLILRRPDLFQAQFVGNILRPSGPGLLSRAVMPWESFANQIPQLFERAHPIQFGMLVVGLGLSLIVGWRTRQKNLLLCWALAISSVYLLVVCLGIHPIQGFWCYGASLSWICFAYCVVRITDKLFNRCASERAIGLIIATLVLVAMLPGAGLRTTLAYVRHWNQADYSNPRFVREVLADVPAEASITVGPEFSLDAYASGRQVILACRHPQYFDSTKYPTKYYLFGRRDFADGFPTGYACTLVRSYGNRDDIFANYAELYRNTE